MDVEIFIARWSEATISERANCQSFIIQLCAVLGVAAPGQQVVGDRDYCFERAVKFRTRSGADHSGFIDCFKSGSFVMEMKQSPKRAPDGDLDVRQLAMLLNGRGRKAPQAGAQGLDRLMSRARVQAEDYAAALPECPPFLMMVDVGVAIHLWADFERSGKGYAPFPDAQSSRIDLTDLRDPQIRERLRRVWNDPRSLDPQHRINGATQEVAELLGQLVRSMRARVLHDPAQTFQPVTDRRIFMFVMQCILAMYADSVGLIRDRGFLTLLESYRGHSARFHLSAAAVFRSMARGGHCAALRQDVPAFGGGLFREEAALPLSEVDLEVLIRAAGCDWSAVEPDIFGTFLEQALEPGDRTELGAHYTPKAYVQRLVEATIIDPLRTDWEALKACASADFSRGDAATARKAVRCFHHDLCRIRVLDPACGTGNFLYFAMTMMKDLERQVLAALRELGDDTSAADVTRRVGPDQFWGIEKSDHAASIAEIVMWVGYLQWRIRNGEAPSQLAASGELAPRRGRERIIRADALLVSAGEDLHRDARGRPISLWRFNQETEVVRYRDPQPTQWPVAHFIIGNPPFMAGKNLRRDLGDGYVDALWQIRQGRFRSADLVMAWWDRAAEILTAPKSPLRRFGFITTNSITQTFSRRVLEHHLNGEPPMRLVFAIPDHPWSKGAERGAEVRIAMTVAERGAPNGQGRLLTIREEKLDASGMIVPQFDEQRGDIGADLTIGRALSHAQPLRANALLCSPGVKLHGAGFIVSAREAAALTRGMKEAPPIRAYRNGRDLAARPRGVKVIDLYGLGENEVRRDLPRIFQHLTDTVKVERDRNSRAAYRDNWWVFGEPRGAFREALNGLPRYIATVERSKHRWFRFLDADVLPDNTVVAIASDDPRILGVLSSRAHRVWALAMGGRLEDRPVYNKKVCFDAFPFPPLDGFVGHEIGAIAEEIDALRNELIAQDCCLTMTALYNQRDSAQFRPLDHLHRRLDAVVYQAYGWPSDMADEDALTALLALNRARAEQEATRDVLFLRPDYQQDRVKPARRLRAASAPRPRAADIRPLPDAPAELAAQVLDILRLEGGPLSLRELSSRFAGPNGRRKTDRVEQMLAILAVVGSVQRAGQGWFSPRGF
ncbi:class I SAM-dependent DNA methyltransferase [Brevundimonas diminuta]|uniref:class I SAM-dependent DNA methyltransferase n=1 Tax=Brevundimonas diminuta TaxID=293 RepID=UPI003CFD1F38